MLGRQPRQQARQAAHQQVDQGIGGHRHKADMQPGNHQQMVGAGARQQLPLRITDTVPVAQHQRAQHPRVPQTAGLLMEPATQRRAGSLQAQSSGGQAFIKGGTAHITATHNALHKQRCLVVITAGIGKTVWPVQTHTKTPALPGCQRQPGVLVQRDARSGQRRWARVAGTVARMQAKAGAADVQVELLKGTTR